MVIVNNVSAAMEDHRKGRLTAYRIHLMDALCAVFALAELHRIDLLPVIAEKRAFNAHRADHQVSNRRAAGGKQY